VIFQNVEPNSLAKKRKKCDKVFQWLVIGWWFSPVSSTNKTDCHDITEIFLKVVLNTIKPNHVSVKLDSLAVCFIGGGNRRKPPTYHKPLKNFIT
jgi:hypothetical protein